MFSMTYRSSGLMNDFLVLITFRGGWVLTGLLVVAGVSLLIKEKSKK